MGEGETSDILDHLQMNVSLRVQPLTGLILGTSFVMALAMGLALVMVRKVIPSVAIPQGTASGVAKPNDITVAYVQATAKDWLSYIYNYNASNYVARSNIALSSCGPAMSADLSDLLRQRLDSVKSSQQTCSSELEIGTPVVRDGRVLVPFRAVSTTWYGALDAGSSVSQGVLALQAGIKTPNNSLLAIVDMEMAAAPAPTTKEKP